MKIGGFRAPRARRNLVTPLAIATVAGAVALAAQSGVLQATVTAPTFQVFAAPNSLRNVDNAGEPSIGVDWATGNVMYQAYTSTYRVSGLATATPTWTDVSPVNTSVVNLDPILFTDARTNRSFAGGLAGHCSVMALTDTDGASWTPMTNSCAGADHETVGGGPFAPGLSGVGYPDTTYYCAHADVGAFCALSVDGGVSFNPATPLWTAATCGGLHGHVKVAPDGTVYVPNGDCGGRAAVAVSTDNGTTWQVRRAPGSGTQDESDPSLAVDRANKAYLCYQDADGRPKVQTTTTRGTTWSGKVDIGAPKGIQNAQFPAAVAGDANRAACAFLGTTASGDDQQSGFAGVWHLYVSVTDDGGSTWTTVDATPTDPVQRGCISLAGTLGGTCTHRNLLDFMDAQIGKDGRIYVGFADGCTGGCVTDPTKNTYTAHATLARQSSGTLLIGP